ncbi:hypothetical protein KKG83_05505 [Candidatus Micrarchaeota archaeon]|nr:hypothetical protein [Candidatus Micrarchaeota archaeon]
MKEDKNKGKDFLLNLMLEAKRIELENKKKMVIFKIKNFLVKPKKTETEIIESLKKSLEKKEAEDLEYMIAAKEGSLALLEKRIEGKKEKETIKELVKIAKEVKNKGGKREKIGIEIGLKKKEMTELEKEIQEKVKTYYPKEKAKEETETAKEKKEKTIKPKSAEEKEAKQKKTRKKKKAVKRIKKGKKKPERKRKKEKISFTSPLKELKEKRETEINQKRKNAMDEFHKEFTSGKEKTLVSIKGDTQIIAGKQQPQGANAMTYKTGTAKSGLKEGKTDEELDFEIEKTKEKIKNLKTAFFHRQINEEDYKKKLFEYQEQQHSLEMDKKRPKTKSYSGKSYAREEPVVFGESGLKTVQEESIQYATKHTPKSKEKVSKALKEFSQEFSAKPYFSKERKTVNETVQETQREIKPLGIIKRLAPETNEKKVNEMESKLTELMQKSNIDKSQLRRELEFVSPKDLMKRFDKILDVIEKKYSSAETGKTEEEKDNIFKEAEVATIKTQEKKEGKIKEIEENKIITDFDTVLNLVNQKGKISEKELAKELKLSPERIKECFAVLEKNELVKIEYPVFGGAKIVSKDYVEPKKEKKKKEKKK